MSAELVQLVEARLGAVADWEAIESPHALVRCRIDTGWVVAKRITATEFAQNKDGTSTRHLNERAALEFFDGVAAPRLLHADDEVIVMEDLGKRPRVIDLLREPSPDTTEAVVAMGEALGRMHAAAGGRLDEWHEGQARAGAMSPLSDSTFDVADHRSELEARLKGFGVDLGRSAWSDVGAMEQHLRSRALRTVLHGDAGPQNALWDGTHVTFLDFEFAAVGHGALDVVSARLGFPHAADAASVPLEIVLEVEDRYQQARGVDRDTFRAGLTAAAGHWSVVRWLGLGDRIGDDQKLASQVLLIIDGYVELAEAHDAYPAWTETISRAASSLRRHHGELPRPKWPAFN